MLWGKVSQHGECLTGTLVCVDCISADECQLRGTFLPLAAAQYFRESPRQIDIRGGLPPFAALRQ